jgi:chromosome segregation ATPase
MDPKVQLDWIIGTQSLEKTDRQRLETIRTNLSVLQKRHEEVDREKESKILTLEVQLVNATGEKFQQAQTVKRLEEETTTLKQDIIKLEGDIANMKEENTRLEEENTTLKQDSIKLEEDITNMKEENTRFVGQSTVVIEGLETKIRGLDDTVASIEEKLSSARRVIAYQKQKAEPALRQKRRIAMKLLACVMELDDDVAVPGEQRPVSALRALEEAPIPLSKNMVGSIFTRASSKSCPKKSMVPLFEDFDREYMEAISPQAD